MRNSIYILLIFGIALGAVLLTGSVMARPVFARTAAEATAVPLRCIDFSPYVNGYNPDTGPHPSAQLMDTLLDRVKKQTSFRCVMIYGVLNGLDHLIPAARQRGLVVMMVIWVNGDRSDAKSIKRGIRLAKNNPDTVLRVSCGSEVSTRKNSALANEAILANCIAKVKNAGIPQPLGTIDTWWKWCVEGLDCKTRSALADQVDWIGVNVFPWWENKYSGAYTCIPAAQAAQFTIDRLQQVRELYTDKEVSLTEFGWPAGPKNYTETNLTTGEHCGIAGEANQTQVLTETLALLDQKGWSGNLFEGLREKWKKTPEGPVGPLWGICKGKPPFKCKSIY